MASTLSCRQAYLRCRRIFSSQIGRLRSPVRTLGQQSGLQEIVARYELEREMAAKGVYERIMEHEDVFVNNELSLRDIKIYGFDYDFTLACYKRTVQEFFYDYCLNHLIHIKKYPSALRDIPADWSFGIRGLHLDISTGLVMKIDAFHHIQLGTVHRGRQPLSDEEVVDIYNGTHIPITDMNSFYGRAKVNKSLDSKPRLRHLNNTFSLSELAILTNMTEFFRRENIPFDPECLINDIEDSIRSAHAHNFGEFHRSVIADAGRYLPSASESQSRVLLERLNSAGKQLAVITNSTFPFVDAGMRHMVGEDWREFFSVIVVDARKPQFYTQRWRPFRLWDTNSGGPLWKKVNELVPGQVYQEGNIHELMRLAGWKPSEMLYIGDDVYSDLADPSLENGIRTGCIVHELEDEIRISNSPQFISKVTWLVQLQRLLEQLQMNNHSLSGRAKELVDKWEKERNSLRTELKVMFNPQFGSLFRTHQNPTYFMRRLGRFADLYTSSLNNLLHYSPDHVFYPRRASLPHEPVL